ncbi:MAG: hypothetical protein C0601_03330 [Candidatus Muiribacterium halophilum]|uniref:PASTA domain-containing protein n=1 Tax=Muiribacterium halophilum TaxID=2053465 RepID=A0A2N5ZJW4_MUIH1|nr:MAG: hypothetical protein C0601_03330 [Candidatus Muirbacterium halophilum]
MFLFISVLVRLYIIQFSQKELWTNETSKVYKKNIEVIGRRGSIIDRNGNEIAASQASYSMYIVPKEIDDIDIFLKKLSGFIEFDFEEKYKSIRKHRKGSFLWFKRGIDAAVYRSIKDVGIKGINFKKEYRRIYPEGNLLANVIGMVGTDKNDFLDNRGLEGLENYFDSDIKGRKTMIEIMTDNRGYNIFSEDTESQFNKYNGADVVLTIDKVIQYWAEQELKKTVEQNEAKKGHIIVMDVRDSELLAVANYPTFDPENFNDYPAKNYKNYAFLDIYEPGSTFKLITTVAALESGNLVAHDTFECQGSIRIDNTPPITCERAHGIIGIEDAIAYSCNVSMVKIALSMKYQEFYDIIKKLGIGQKTGIPFTAEGKGIVRQPSKIYSRRDIASMGFGQGVALTNLQMCTAYSAITNGGIYHKPKLVKYLKKNGEIIKDYTKDQGRRVISKEHSDKVRSLLKAVVERGSGQKVKLKNFGIGGKTGTAQKAGPHGYKDDKYISSFIGVFPIDNPEILFYVVIDEPSAGSYYGGTVAAPAFKHLFENIVDYRRMSPDRLSGNNIRKDMSIVPNFVGLKRGIAINRVQMLNINYKSFGEGDFVVFQEHSAGNIQKKDTTVELYFGDLRKNETGKDIMPDMRGFTMRKAIRTLNKLNIPYEIKGNGYVRKQLPAPGIVLDEQSVIKLEFSL